MFTKIQYNYYFFLFLTVTLSLSLSLSLTLYLSLSLLGGSGEQSLGLLDWVLCHGGEQRVTMGLLFRHRSLPSSLSSSFSFLFHSEPLIVVVGA